MDDVLVEVKLLFLLYLSSSLIINRLFITGDRDTSFLLPNDFLKANFFIMSGEAIEWVLLSLFLAWTGLILIVKIFLSLKKLWEHGSLSCRTDMIE
jgi:hypothetical protein